MIDYRFNQWRMSGEQATEWTEADSILTTFYYEGKVLYLHFVKGMSAKELKKKHSSKLSLCSVDTILRGYSLKKPNEIYTFYIAFMELLKNSPDRLYQIFKEVA